MDLKGALKAALPAETRRYDLEKGPLHRRMVELAEHLEELGSLWFKIEHNWMVEGRHRINRATGRPYQWYEYFFLPGENPNQVRKLLSRFLETNRPDVLAAVYDDQANPPVDRVTPVLARLQKQIYDSVEHDGSYNDVSAIGCYPSPNLPSRYKSRPMELRCAALFLKRYDETTSADKRKAVLKKVVARRESTDTAKADTLRKTYQKLGGDCRDLEFWDEHLAKVHAERKRKREEWAALDKLEQQD